jgi:arabinan endo-1,5-alpha-L-arabinosidase
MLDRIRRFGLVQLLLLATVVMVRAEGSYTNPVIAPVAADPTIIRAPDGIYYLYTTQDDWGDGSGGHYVPIFRSPDLVDWVYVKDAFAWPPAWKRGGGFFWAPDVSYRDGTYYMYYAASLWGDPDPCIGLATAPHPEGPWNDIGRSVFCSSDIGVPNSIDPFLWDDGRTRQLVWGSFHGIYAVELSADGTEARGEKVELADSRFEAPHVIEREGSYYLFLSSGSCCNGADSSYTTWVGRAEELLGPYLDRHGGDLRFGGGEIVLQRNRHWVGPGHNSIAADDANQDWIVYHAIDPENPRLPNGATRRPLLIDRIEWVDGWPVVNGGQGPSNEDRQAPTIDGAR